MVFGEAKKGIFSYDTNTNDVARDYVGLNNTDDKGKKKYKNNKDLNIPFDNSPIRI